MSSPVPAIRDRRSERGFVMSELVLVVVIVTALIAIVIVSLNGIDDDSASRECQTELRAIKAASEQFYAELNFYPPDDQALKDANLMELDESPNYRVVTPDGADKPTYETVGSRCA
ncbi:type IV pilin protein [Aquihabitans daechungensis]|uniref:type IV pilin protein n=1 Tax=Aquihabitans daechungensis TaxID=1052257 RepID=UPI003BA3B22A